MEEIRDCKGRLACKGNAETGAIVCMYKGYKTSTNLGVGDKFTIEREGIETVITRISPLAFAVESHPA